MEGQLLSWCYRFIFASHISILVFISSIADTKGPRSHTLLTEPERKKTQSSDTVRIGFCWRKMAQMCRRKFPWIECHVPTMAQKKTSVVLFRFSSISLVNAYAKPIGKYFGALAWSTAWSFPKGTLMCLSKEISTGTLHAVAQRMLVIDDSMLECRNKSIILQIITIMALSFPTLWSPTFYRGFPLSWSEFFHPRSTSIGSSSRKGGGKLAHQAGMGCTSAPESLSAFSSFVGSWRKHLQKSDPSVACSKIMRFCVQVFFENASMESLNQSVLLLGHLPCNSQGPLGFCRSRWSGGTTHLQAKRLKQPRKDQ